MPYRPILWLPLALLHGGLLFRVVGDALGRGALWQGGSVVTVVSLLVFAASAAWCVVRGDCQRNGGWRSGPTRRGGPVRKAGCRERHDDRCDESKEGGPGFGGRAVDRAGPC